MNLAAALPENELDNVRWRVRYFSIEWYGETPIKLHDREIGKDGAPIFSGQFESYLEEAVRSKLNPPDRSRRVDLHESPMGRVTRAFRKLRWKAPREYYVLFGMCVIDQVGRDLKQSDTEALRAQFDASLRRSAQRLNASIAKSSKGPSPLLSESDVLVLVTSGVHKLTLWAG